jgi:hypothetical protein
MFHMGSCWYESAVMTVAPFRATQLTRKASRTLRSAPQGLLLLFYYEVFAFRHRAVSLLQRDRLAAQPLKLQDRVLNKSIVTSYVFIVSLT